MQGIKNFIAQSYDTCYKSLNFLEIKQEENYYFQNLKIDQYRQLVEKLLRGQISIQPVDPNEFKLCLEKNPNYNHRSDYVKRKFKALPLALCHALLLNVVILVQISVLSMGDIFIKSFALPPLVLPKNLAEKYEERLDTLIPNCLRASFRRLESQNRFTSRLVTGLAILNLISICFLAPAQLFLLSAGLSLFSSLIMTLINAKEGEVLPAIISNFQIAWGYLRLLFSKDDLSGIIHIHQWSLERSFHFKLNNFLKNAIQPKKLIRILKRCPIGALSKIVKNLIHFNEDQRMQLIKFFTSMVVDLFREFQLNIEDIPSQVEYFIKCLEKLTGNLKKFGKISEEKTTQEISNLRRWHAQALVDSFHEWNNNRLVQLQYTPHNDPELEKKTQRELTWLIACLPYIETPENQIIIWENAIKNLEVMSIPCEGDKIENFYAWHNKMVDSVNGIFENLVKEQQEGLCQFLIANPHLSYEFAVHYPQNDNTFVKINAPHPKYRNFLNLTVLFNLPKLTQVCPQDNQLSVEVKKFMQFSKSHTSINYLFLISNRLQISTKIKIPLLVKCTMIGALFLKQFPRGIPHIPDILIIAFKRALEQLKKEYK